MGVDLTLVPEQWHNRERFASTTRIQLDQDPALFERLEAFASEPLPSDTDFRWSFGEDGEQDTRTDHYGEPLRFVRAAVFREINIAEVKSGWNRAVLAMMQALPSPTRVMLYWC